MDDTVQMPSVPGPGVSSEDLSAVARAASEAATDQMVERLAMTLERTLGALEALTQPEKVAAFEALAERLQRLEESGSWDALEQFALVMKAMGAAATDQMIERLSVFAEGLASSALTPGLLDLAGAAAASATAAAEETAVTEIRPGALGLLASLRDPETRRGLEFLLRFAKHLQQKLPSG